MTNTAMTLIAFVSALLSQGLPPSKVLLAAELEREEPREQIIETIRALCA